VTSLGPGSDGVRGATDRLQAIYDRARASLTLHLDTIDAAVSRLAQGALDENDRHAAERAAHRLAGAAGTVGYPDATAPARELEDAFAGDPGPDEAGNLRELFATLRSALSGDGVRDTDDEI
jgi:HPt (histidine-containing phosphotransfer) domain-containing protein